MEAHEAVEGVEKTHAAVESHHRLARLAAAVVAVLAVLLAVANLAANSAAGTTLLDQQRASDSYNELQANSLKRHINENTALLLRALPVGGAQATSALADASGLDKAVKQKYQPNEARLLPVARQLESDRDTAEAQDHNLHLAEVALQIAIVLTSVAILIGRTALMWLGGTVGAIGAVLLANGLWMVVRVPG